MSKKRYQVGDEYGRWTIISLPEGRSALCRCACGSEGLVFKSHLGTGKSKGCRKCRDVDGYVKHGMHNTKTYKTWADMKRRCLNPEYAEWDYYGGRGITVCEKWLSFEGFFEDMGERPEGMTIDRIDVNGGYTKENCRWASPVEQANNTRRSRRIIHKGQAYTMAELAAVLGLNFHTLRTRLARGTSLDRPPKSEGRK